MNSSHSINLNYELHANIFLHKSDLFTMNPFYLTACKGATFVEHPNHKTLELSGTDYCVFIKSGSTLKMASCQQSSNIFTKSK